MRCDENDDYLSWTTDIESGELADSKPEAYEPSPNGFAAESQHGLAAEELGELSVNSGAPWPPLQIQRPNSVLPFPVDVFPQQLQAYCQEVADAMLVPCDFVGASMLAVAGAAICQSVNIEVKRGWTQAPLLYMILVAPPGRTKSPVITEVVKPLAAIDAELREQSVIDHCRWKAARDAAHLSASDVEDPLSDESAAESQLPDQEPPQRRMVVKDITRESLVIILADNPRGVLCDPDEASGWVASFNEYKGKGGADRQFWLSIWSSTSVSVDRKGGRESTHVKTPFVTVLGGLPPDMLNSLSDERGRNDGFMDRILFT
jgi:hypothetical protein